MSDPFIAEIHMFAGNFAPRGWAFCDGQLLPIAQNTALFSLLGTTYGGDGRTTFGVPNLRGRAPMHPGNGPGLTSRRRGELGGTETVSLSETNLPSHAHKLRGASSPASASAPSTSTTLARSVGGNAYRTSSTPGETLANESLLAAGGSSAHNNMQPFLAINFIIALVGVFPSRS